MPKGFYLLILAQFASGLADNALMILGIYFLQEQGYPGWWSPLLKFSFTLSYVALASVVGPVVDAFVKGRLMACMNLLKLVGVGLLLCGVQPFVGFALAGLAAAVYAPAKYALVTQSVPPALLVKANAWLEVSVVMSVMLGVALGGAMIHVYTLVEVPDFVPLHGFESPLGVSTQVWGAFAWVAVVYGISALFNIGVGTAQVQPCQPLTWSAMRWSAFWHHQRQLWSDPLGGMSLYVTTLCWGVGAVLQFVVLVWAQSNAGLTLQGGAYLQGLVALGVMGGGQRGRAGRRPARGRGAAEL